MQLKLASIERSYHAALKKNFGVDLQIDHKFSAEIVPFKQAYIERNFHPKILFRDIRELGMKNVHVA